MAKQNLKKRLDPIEIFAIRRARELREDHDMTQLDLSVALGKSSGFIGDVERLAAKYNLKHINKLAEIFDCSPRDFLPEKPLS